MASATQFTWNSWAGGWLVNGPIGPKIMNMLGNPRVDETEMGARPVGPLLAQLLAVATADVDLHVVAGHGVEAGGEHDDVEVVLVRRRADAVGRDLLDRLVAEVDEGDVVAVEGLVVAVVAERAAGVEVVRA